MFMVLNRALNGQEAKRMWGALSLNENINPNQNANKSKLASALQFWK